MARSIDSFGTRSTFTVGDKTFTFYSLPKLATAVGKDLSKLPFSLRILLENLLRNEDGNAVVKADIEALAGWNPKTLLDTEIAFTRRASCSRTSPESPRWSTSRPCATP